MKIIFILTEPTNHIVGGYKTVYDLCNFLVKKNNEVIIYYSSFNMKINDLLKYPFRMIISKKRIKWYNLNSKIKKKYILISSNSVIESADCYILTASALVNAIEQYNLLDLNKTIHFIQDHEIWATSEQILKHVYSLPTRKVVVSHWLKDLVEEYSPTKINIISNGVDLDMFKIKNSIKNRNPYSIAMLFHTDKRKGIERSINILIKLKEEFPDLKCIMFGSPQRSKIIPNWVEYYRNVSQNELPSIYNQCSIYFCGSYYEGFGLTGLESLICGCALVSTDTKGVREYAQNDYNALLSDPNDDNQLYLNLKKLLLDTNLKNKIANNASKKIKEHDKYKQMEKFLKIIKEG